MFWPSPKTAWQWKDCSLHILAQHRTALRGVCSTNQEVVNFLLIIYKMHGLQKNFHFGRDFAQMAREKQLLVVQLRA
jgi:hypothetical protein